MTTKPNETPAAEMAILKVHPSRHKMLSVIATLDGRLLQDVTDEAVSEYIARRGLSVSMDSTSSVAATTHQS